jgi:polar amino acid transport system permease protein
VILQTNPNPIQDILIVLGYWDKLLSGFIVTLWLYGWAIFIGFFLGLSLAMLRQYGGWLFSRISTAYIEFMRGTPLLMQIFLIYYVPLALNFPVGHWVFKTSFVLADKNITIVLFNQQILAGIITLGLNSSAYQAEYFRGAFMSIGSGQLMAAQSLGMSRISGIRNIILPQALRRVIPAWSNEAAYLPKYTVIVYFIGVAEIFFQVHSIVSDVAISLTTYIIVAILFLILISLISKLLEFIHHKTSIPGL